MEAETAGLLGTLIGACVSIATTFLSNRHAISMQSSADAIQREEKARAFQRENLLACQDTMQLIGRLTAQAFHEEAVSWGQGTPWGEHTFSKPLDDELAEQRRKFSILIERVADDKLRNELKLMSLSLSHVLLAESFEEANSRLTTAHEASANTMKLLGIVLRKTY